MSMLVAWVYLVSENWMSYIFDICAFFEVSIIFWPFGGGGWFLVYLLGLDVTVRSKSSIYVCIYIWQEFYSLGGIGLVKAADKCIISHSHCFGLVPLMDARWLEQLQASHANATISSGKRAAISSYLSIFNIEENLSQILPSSHKACSVI